MLIKACHILEWPITGSVFPSTKVAKSATERTVSIFLLLFFLPSSVHLFCIVLKETKLDVSNCSRLPILTCSLLYWKGLLIPSLTTSKRLSKRVFPYKTLFTIKGKGYKRHYLMKVLLSTLHFKFFNWFSFLFCLFNKWQRFLMVFVTKAVTSNNLIWNPKPHLPVQRSNGEEGFY